MNKKSSLVLCFIVALALPLAAQQTKETATSGWSDDDPPVWTSWKEQPPLLYQDETPEQRMARAGLAEDPGTNPDESIVWEREGKPYKITRFPRERATYAGQKRGWVRPMAGINSSAEIYYENEQYVWVWIEMPGERSAAALSSNVKKALGLEAEEAESEKESAPEPPGPKSEQKPVVPRNTEYVKLSAEARAYLTELKKEFGVTTPMPSGVTIAFEESSAGLPTRGSWRNGLDVADMNGDGLLDIIAPSQRGGNGFPVIFLGTSGGTWVPWEAARWPGAWNYGTVAAGDLDGDGAMDLVVGAHLMRPVALLGDGKGTFRDASEGLPKRFPTRRVALGDADGDGDPDLFVITEGATVSRVEGGSRLRLYLNEDGAKQWREVQVSEAGREVGGDWLTLGDFNGDRRLDVAGSSVFFSGPDLVYLQNASGGWNPWGRGSIPFRSYYSAVTNGRFSGAKGTDLILSYRRVWPRDLIRPGEFEPPSALSVVGLERVTWGRRGRPHRTPIVSWDGAKPVWGLASGDFNGDGRLDLVYTAMPPRRLEFLLGDGKGGFTSAAATGIDLPDRTTYDIKVADVNGDRRDDILLMFEKSDRSSDGSIRVWLGKGPAAAGGAKDGEK